MASACDLGDENLGEGDEGGGGMCEILDEALPAETTTIRLTNATSDPIWIPGGLCPGITRLRFTVDGVEYVDEPLDYRLCSQSYSEVNDNLWCAGGSDCDDRVSGTLRIGAGESYDMPWSHYAFTRVAIEPACRGEFCDENASCYAGRELTVGSQISLQVEANGKCSLFGDELCDCEDPNQETCALPTGEQAFVGPELVGTVDFELADGVVEVVISG